MSNQSLSRMVILDFEICPWQCSQYLDLNPTDPIRSDSKFVLCPVCDVLGGLLVERAPTSDITLRQQ